MEKILFEKDVCRWLNIPSIPLKKFSETKKAFKNGVAVTKLFDDRKAYAVATFDPEEDEEPRITKVFAREPFYGVEDIFVVPDYMDNNVEEADLDEESKKAAAALAQEARELEEQQEEEEMKESIPENPFCFDEIHNLEEARAWLTNYYQKNRIKGKAPHNEETVKLRLLTIWTEQHQKDAQ